MSRHAILLLVLQFVAILPAIAEPQVGTDSDTGTTWVPTYQAIRPAGETFEFAGRPVDLCVTRDGATVYLKDNRGLVAVNTADWSLREEVPLGKDLGGSMHGIACTADGKRIYLSSAQDRLIELEVTDSGRIRVARRMLLPPPKADEPVHATGIALDEATQQAWVCFSRNNTLALIDLDKGEVVKQIPVGVAPFDVVLSPDGALAYVSNWGGRRPDAGESSADSSGTKVLVDERGVATSGTVSVVDLAEGKELAQIATGLHPSDLVLSKDGARLFVANANSDSVSLIDTNTRQVIEEVIVKPDDALPFGSAPNALALAEEAGLLYVALGGNNAVALLDVSDLLDGEKEKPADRVRGFVPTGWYPGALALHEGTLYIANTKGIGSRSRQPEDPGWKVHRHRGTVGRLPLGEVEAKLATYTQQVRENGMIPLDLRAWERSTTEAAPKPIPDEPGQPSVFEHVVYIVKENRTYDQVFGDLPQGNSDPSLCIFPREITPNQHALAEQFVLLDNFYCNGVNSADGHSWVTEGNVTDHLEKSFGGFTRSYSWGNDALNYSATGFIWDRVLAAGLSFRNYGEFNYTEPFPLKTSFTKIYENYKSGGDEVRFVHKIGVERLQRYSHPEYPGWNMRIPDVLRADVFLKELASFEADGHLPNLMMVYLPQDHTSGTEEEMPTPRAHVADNDLAVGRIVEGLSKSRFWPKTCIFIIEDDPQDGFDHVDGHRSICMVVSPYAKRGAVINQFYNQTSVLRTIAAILGTPPLTQFDTLSPLMDACFTEDADLTPYTALPNNVPLDEMNPPKEALQGDALRYAQLSAEQDFEHVDAADEDTLNRILWHAMKGVDTPYPAHLAGAHGVGLKALGLAFDGRQEE
jgi:YVTN family beta-propeller protein